MPHTPSSEGTITQFQRVSTPRLTDSLNQNGRLFTMKFTPRNLAFAAVVGAAYCALTVLARPDILRASPVPRCGGALYPAGLHAGQRLGALDRQRAGQLLRRLRRARYRVRLAGHARLGPVHCGAGQESGAAAALWPLHSGVLHARCMERAHRRRGHRLQHRRLLGRVPLNMLQLAVGEAGVLFIIGLPLMKLLPRSRAFMQIARA